MLSKYKNKLIFNYGPIENINLYSTIEEVLKSIRNPTFIHRVSVWNFQNFIYSRKKNAKKIDKYVKKIKELKDVKINSNMPYGFELRVKPLNLIYSIKNH